MEPATCLIPIEYDKIPLTDPLGLYVFIEGKGYYRPVNVDFVDAARNQTAHAHDSSTVWTLEDPWIADVIQVRWISHCHQKLFVLRHRKSKKERVVICFVAFEKDKVESALEEILRDYKPSFHECIARRSEFCAERITELQTKKTMYDSLLSPK